MCFFVIMATIKALRRQKEMSDLANEFGFRYIRKGEQILSSSFPIVYRVHSNLITGNYNGVSFDIKDVLHLLSGLLIDGRLISTVINGKEHGIFFPVSVNKLRKYIKGEIELN